MYKAVTSVEFIVLSSRHEKEWIKPSEIETRGKANLLRTDGGGEYMGTEWLKARGIHHGVTNANTPQENGVAERLNKTILEMTRTMMHEFVAICGTIYPGNSEQTTYTSTIWK